MCEAGVNVKVIQDTLGHKDISTTLNMYETFVRHQIGSKTVSSLRKTDIKRFYNYLADERHLKPATIDNIHTVLHQILDMAVDDDYIRNNPSNNVLTVAVHF